jgi:hypothetical protein
MAGTVEDALPWYHPGSHESENASETTPGGTESVRWVVIAVNVNPGEAVIIKGRLQSEDIPAVVQQEALGSVLGLTVGPLGSAKVLVPEPLAERALTILSETFEASEDESWHNEFDDDVDPDLITGR